MGKNVGNRHIRRKDGVMMADFVARYLKLWWERDLSLEEMASRLGVTAKTLRNLHNDKNFSAFIRAHRQREIDELTPLAVGKLRELLESDNWQAVARGLVIWGKWSGTEVTRVQAMNLNIDLVAGGDDASISGRLRGIARWAKQSGGISRDAWIRFFDEA